MLPTIQDLRARAQVRQALEHYIGVDHGPKHRESLTYLPFTAVMRTSTCAPPGSAATAYAARAGGFSWK